MSINDFIPGSSLFRKHLEKTALSDDFYKFFITQTLKPEFCQGKTVNEQFKESIQSILIQVGFFDFAHIVSELHENGNLHYHILCVIKKDRAKTLHDKLNYTFEGDSQQDAKHQVVVFDNIYDSMLYKYKSMKNKLTKEIFNYTQPHLDFESFTLKPTFIDYLHKDIDRLYKCANGWKTVKFVIYSKYEQLTNLNSLINFKHNK